VLCYFGGVSLEAGEIQTCNFVSVGLLHVYYTLRHISFAGTEFLSETFALYLTESTRKAQSNTNAVVQLTFSSAGWCDWNWHSRGITSGLAFTVLCALLSCWICASVTPDTSGREKAILHTLTTHEVASCPLVSAWPYCFLVNVDRIYFSPFFLSHLIFPVFL